MIRQILKLLPFAGVVLAASAACPAKALNLVTNGDFEDISPFAVGQMAPANSSLGSDAALPAGGIIVTGWTKTIEKDSGSQGFAFIVDGNADTTGFPSINSKTTGTPGNIKTHPGFRTSANGGYMMGIDGDYGRSSISQTISGLTVGKTYKLAFEYAGTQFTDQTGATNQYWQVQFGGDTKTTSTMAVPSAGFVGWANEAMTFTAANTTQELKFTAYGSAVSGTGSLPPFLLLDGISMIEDVPPPDPKVAAPGPLPLLGAAAAWRWGRTLRRRVSGDQA